MRHRVYGRHLGRDKDERTRLFKTLLQALFTHGTIETSQGKGKAIKGLVDRVINLAKNRNSRRLLHSFVNSKDLEERLIKEIVPKLGNRTSGYTSLVRLGTRVGDRTMMVRMSLIGTEKLEPIKQVTSKKTEGLIKKEVKVKEKTTRKSISEKKDRTGQSVRKTTRPSKGSKSTKRGTSRLSKTK